VVNDFRVQGGWSRICRRDACATKLTGILWCTHACDQIEGDDPEHDVEERGWHAEMVASPLRLIVSCGAIVGVRL